MDESTKQSAVISDMLEPLTEALTPESAQLLANLKAKPSVQSRINKLAEKCNEGTLTESERTEYESYVRVGNLLNILRAHAKKALAQQS